MNIDSMCAAELIKHSESLSNMTVFTKALVKALIDAESKIDKVYALSEEIAGIVED